MSLARRSILKLLGAAPVMLPTAATAAVPLLAKAEPIAALALAAAPAPVGAFLRKQLQDLKSQFSDEDYWQQRMRIDGIDPDLACLRSVSRAYKITRMTERHRVRFSLTRRLEKLLWPDT